MNFFPMEQHLFQPGSLMEQLIFHGIMEQMKINSNPNVFYGNTCKVCFEWGKLKKCASCKTVSYCSTQHQRADWPFHKQLCKALKIANENIICPKNGTFEDFGKYREKLATHIEKNLGKNVTLFEKQISTFPWVCSVCYSKENLDFECEKCTAVVYCSLKHKKQDEKSHKPSCNALKLAKTCDSLNYENGFVLNKVHENLRIPDNINNFPSDMKTLYHVLINKVIDYQNMQNEVQLSCFSVGHSILATALYVLEKMGHIRKRVYNKKPLLTKDERQRRCTERSFYFNLKSLVPFVQFDTKHTMVIHFVVSGIREIKTFRREVTNMLLLWIRNIDFVKVILVGESLEEFEKPMFEEISSLFNVQLCPLPYQQVVNHLTKPDLIVLQDYCLAKKFDSIDSLKALFNHRDVPVIVTSIKESYLTDFVDEAKKINNVRLKLNIQRNPFAEQLPCRSWDEKQISTSYVNEYVTVLMQE